MLHIITSMARHLLTLGAGYLVAKGLIPEDLAGEVVVAGLAVVAIGWSSAERWYTGYKNTKRMKEAINATVTSVTRDLSVERLRADGGLRD